MKKIIAIVCMLVILFRTFAQEVIPSLDITTQKTTSLIFPSAIKHADRGSADILVQQVDQSENILLVKGAKKDFEQTNLSIITADGKVYSFLINYKSTPSCFVYHIDAPSDNPGNNELDTTDKVIFTGGGLSQPTIETYAKVILISPRQLFSMWHTNWGVKAALSGLYIKDNIIFVQLLLHNQSSINYDIDLIRFSIKDKKRSKRTAFQEKGVYPIYSTGKQNVVEAGKQNVIVFAIPKFTIPEQQYLSIEVIEKNGGRHLSMKLSNKSIIKAKQLPAFE